MIRIQHLWLVAAVVLALAHGVKADEYVKIGANELKANPQSYWARGIVFSDFLDGHPTAEEIKLGDRKYYPVQLRTLGTCYVEATVRDAVGALALGDEYIFTGSVYQKESGIFFSKRKFFVVIERVTNTVKHAGEVAEALRQALAQAGTNHPFAQPLQALDEVLTAAQRDLQAYCAASNVDLQAVFTPGSPHAAKAVQSVRQSLYALENKTKVPTVEFAVSLVTSLLAAHNGGLKLTPEPAPVTAPEPAPQSAPVVLPEAAPELQPDLLPEAPAEPETVPEPEASPTAYVEPDPVTAPVSPEPEAVSAQEPLAEEPKEPTLEDVPAADEFMEATPEAGTEVIPEVQPEPMPEPEPTVEVSPEPAPVMEAMPENLPLIDAPAVALEEPAAPAPEPVVEEVPPVAQPAVVEPEPEVKTSLPGAKLKLALEPAPETVEPAPVVAEPKPKAKSKAKPASKPLPKGEEIDLNAPVPLR